MTSKTFSTIQIIRTNRTTDNPANKAKGTISHTTDSFSLSMSNPTSAVIVSKPKYLAA